MESVKNVAIVVAGGSGTRMGQDIPKQFINVFDKPGLVYTLESFQRHPDIDAIEVVCIEGWETMAAQAFRNPSETVWNSLPTKSVRKTMSSFMMAFGL